MTLTLDDVQELLRTLEEHPELRARFSMLLLADELYKLPEQFRRLGEIVTQLAEAQRRTEERLETLAARVDDLAEAHGGTDDPSRWPDGPDGAPDRTGARVGRLATR